MKYNKIDQRLFIENRAKFAAALKPNAVAIFNASDIYPKSADGTRHFVQQTDLFYLSGVDQEESILLLSPQAKDPEMREVLFLRETNETIAVWEGAKLTKEQAREVSGIQSIYWLQDFERILTQLIFEAEYVYLNTNEHLRADVSVQTRDDRFRKWMMEKYPLHKYERSAPIMHRLRAVKSALEIEQLQRACDITAQGFNRLLGFVKPGVWEYEIEAELYHEFIRSRSKGMAFDPIIASGASACVLHYVENDKQCKDGDLLLTDFGAEYANYNGDLTRTIPVNGRYTPRQRAVYDAVLRVHNAALDILVPGNNWTDYHEEVGRIMTSELLGLGLLDQTDVKNQDPKWPAYKKYFMHGTSHHLGLDVHDYGNKYHAFEAGMVFTVEPGIYIPEEAIGIRLENDYVVQDGKPFNLLAKAPIEAEEIEEIMNSKR